MVVPMTTLLEVTGLTVRYTMPQGAVTAVDGLSFSIPRGGSLALVGESGSGKSTAALALARLLPRNAALSGRVTLDGTDVLALDGARLRALRGRRIAYVFQDPMASLNPYLTVGAQLREVLALHGGLRGDAATRRAAELLDEVRLPDAAARLGQYPHELSGGQRQRAMIAMALAGRPDLLVADEPTTALDVTVQAQILALIRELRRERGLALLLVSHDLGVVAGECERVLVMRDGRRVEEADARALFKAPAADYTRALLAAVPRL
jgi:ABC-type glutathione transport system ATPase component